VSLEENKQIAGEFLARFTASDVDGALAAMTDDATWWIAGKSRRRPGVGMHDKVEIERVFRGMLDQLKDGLRMTVKSAIAEGDRVALEVVSRGELRNGRVYEQEYHMLMTIRDGKISAVREYLDTQHVLATWFAP
jgi:ketosteroid isomerase-like protein